MNQEPINPPEPQAEALPELKAALRQLYPPAPNVPADIDAAVRATVRLHFTRKKRPALRYLIPVAGMAAALLFGVLLQRWDAAKTAPASRGDGEFALRAVRPNVVPETDTFIQQAPELVQENMQYYALRVEPAPSQVTLGAGGRVTILDAYALARRLKSGAATSSESDVNADGVVDQGDVDALAMAAVRLEGGI